jgi:hypothetical protein
VAIFFQSWVVFMGCGGLIRSRRRSGQGHKGVRVNSAPA